MRRKIYYSVSFLLFCAGFLNAQFVLSGEFRPRAELRDGFKTPSNDEDKAAFFIEQRSRINFNFIDSSYTFRLSLQDIRIWGETDQIFKQENGNTFLSEAWVEYNLATKLSIKAGRQILSYDNQRYMGGLEWAQQGRRHDAVIFKYNDKNNRTKIDLGLAFNADDDIAEPKNIQSPNADYYSKNNYKFMQYGWFNKRFDNVDFSLLAVNLGFQYLIDKVSWRQTLGTHGKTKRLTLNFGWDAYYQLGKQGQDDVSAYLLGANINYDMRVTPLVLGIEIISGKDGDDLSSDISYFSPDFGTNHAHNGYMDYFFVGPSNGKVGLTDLYFKTEFRLNKTSLSVHGHQFFTGSQQFGTNNNKLSRSLGSELDFVYSIPLRKDAKIQLGYSFLIASESLRTIRDRDSEFNSWAWLMFTVKPELFSAKK